MKNEEVHNFQFVVFVIVVLVMGVIVYFAPSQKFNTQIGVNQNFPSVNHSTLSPLATPSISLSPAPTPTPSNFSLSNVIISEPVDKALNRVTKKPFGIKISPQDSPVSPERFSGYHTGVDFETFSDEQNIDVPIFAICSGHLVLKKYASGYGGAAVQLCKINDKDATVIYGHLRLSSVAAKVNQTLDFGEQIGVLGAGYSSETDGERKHLHLGIHKGKNIVLLGYVKTSEELNSWIDAMELLYEYW